MKCPTKPRQVGPDGPNLRNFMDTAILAGQSTCKAPFSPASTSALQITPMSRLVRIALLCFSGALLLFPRAHADPEDTWQPFPPEELTSTSAPLEPDAAAEVLFQKIEVDDSDFPNSRTTTEYTRYKIFDPERADNIVRLSQYATTANGTDVRTVDMSARLTLPDGTAKEFGAESIHEQNVVRANLTGTFFTTYADSVEVKRKFMAVGGAQPGSILEFNVRTIEQHPPHTGFRPLQIADVPIRRLEYIHHLGQARGFQTSCFVLNGDNLETKEDKESLTVTLTGHDLPSLHNEPFSGVTSYYSATVVTCYDSTTFLSLKGIDLDEHFSTTTDPWMPYATIGNWFLKNHVEDTRAVRKAAREITQGATTDLEKAQRIHDYVQNLHQKFVHRTKKNQYLVSLSDTIVSMNDVLSFEENDPPMLSSIDFLWLDISLDRAAGLHTEALLLPNRTVARFDLRLSSMAFLPEICAAIEVDGQWHFSMPHLRTPIAFDQLPWTLEGQPALLALEKKQQFIDVPAAAAEESVTKNEGTFTLDADGTLTGQCKRTLTGHYAFDARALLNKKKAPDNILRRILRRELKPAEIDITGIENLDDLGKPVEISYTLTWTGFATVADNRMFIHPFVFHANSVSPFTATERKNPIYFPFKHQDDDHLTIQLPPGYEVEVKVEPQSQPGDILSHTLSLAYDEKHHILHVDRAFSSSLIAVEQSNYAKLKQWYDDVANCDQYQLILAQTTAPVATNQTAP
jgi:hypothetical protein